MIKNNYSIEEMICLMEMDLCEDFISLHEMRFINRFNMFFDDKVEIKLILENSFDANDIYNEIKYNIKYASKYKVRSDYFSSNILYISGSKTLFDYFGTKEPNVLTLSRDYNLSIKIEYKQDLSGIEFSGEIKYGELLGRNTHIEVNMELPELALGGLRKIASSASEFNLLLTRFYRYETERII